MFDKYVKPEVALSATVVRNRFVIGHLLRQTGYTNIGDLDRDFWQLKYPLQGLSGQWWDSARTAKRRTKRQEKHLSSKLLHKYWRGDLPISSAAIEQFEAIYPGSRYHAENAMWVFLLGEFPTLNAIDKFLGSLPQTLKVHLFQYDRTLGREVRSEPLTFETIACISREGHYDAMGCLLGLLWESRLQNRSSLVVDYCADEIANLLRRLVSSIPFLEQAIELREIIFRHPGRTDIDSKQAWLTAFDLASAQTTNARLISQARLLRLLGSDPDEIADFLFWSCRDNGVTVLSALDEVSRQGSNARREIFEVLHRLRTYREQPKTRFQNILLVGHQI